MFCPTLLSYTPSIHTQPKSVQKGLSGTKSRVALSWSIVCDGYHIVSYISCFRLHNRKLKRVPS